MVPGDHSLNQVVRPIIPAAASATPDDAVVTVPAENAMTFLPMEIM
jgi:hypothetical protein